MDATPVTAPMSEGLGWNDFGEFNVVTCTTAKLAQTLQEIDFENTLTRNGDNLGEPSHPSAYHHIMQVTHTGGRDWAIIVGLEYPAN